MDNCYVKTFEYPVCYCNLLHCTHCMACCSENSTVIGGSGSKSLGGGMVNDRQCP